MVILLQQKNFGPNVIYFALGMTEGRPAGAFWAEKNATQGGAVIDYSKSEIYDIGTEILLLQ